MSSERLKRLTDTNSEYDLIVEFFGDVSILITQGGDLGTALTIKDSEELREFFRQIEADECSDRDQIESSLEIGREAVENFIRDIDRMMKAMLAERLFNFDPEYVLAAQGSDQEPQEGQRVNCMAGDLCWYQGPRDNEEPQVDREPWLWLRQVKNSNTRSWEIVSWGRYAPIWGNREAYNTRVLFTDGTWEEIEDWEDWDSD